MEGSSNSQDERPFIAHRLSLIIPPANAKPIKPKAKKKSSRRSREMVLKNFVDLPLDIIYETVAYLEPMDLLNLARLSKEFRALFMSRSSLAIWRRVLSDVPNLPPCPRDLSEPQFASLVFEKFCMACGSSRGSIDVDYKTRLRLCATCTRANIIRGYEIRAKCDGYQDVVLTLLPFFTSPFFFLHDTSDLSSTQNELAMSFFKPEAEMMISELAKFTDTQSDEYLRFVAREQENATRMINEGRALMQYREDMVQAREDADEEMAERRYTRIKQEMQTLGWDEEYFPRWNDEDDYDKWEEYMFQPKEFTARGWSLIRPKLTSIYNRTKQCRQMEILIERTTEVYLAFRDSKTVEERRRLPMWGDLFTLDFMMQFFWRNYASCSDEKLTEIMRTIEEGSRDFLEIIENDLAAMISECDPTQVLQLPDWLIQNDIHDDSDLDTDDEHTKAVLAIRDKLNERSKVSAVAASAANAKDKGKGKAKADSSASAQEMLNRAANLFMCHCPSCNSGQWDKRRALSYPAVVDHAHNLSISSQHWMKAKPETNIDVIQAARDVLVSLGLAEDCTRAEVDALGEFVCDCGHYLYEGLLSFDQLVDHVYHQQLTFAIVNSQSIKGCDETLLINGHSRQRLPELVRIATDEDRLSPKDLDADSDASVETVQRRTDIPSGKYCRYCYQLMYEGWPFDEAMAYHLKFMHGKEFHDDAFETLTVLRGRYGHKFNEAMLFFPFFSI